MWLDDILVTGSTEAEHLDTLDRVMSRLEEHGLHLKLSKCVFMAPSVEYLCHHISADGIRPAEGRHRGRSETSECWAAEIVCGSPELLRQVFAQHALRHSI